MGVDGIQAARVEGGRKLRADEARVVLRLPAAAAWCGPALVALGLFFVLFGGADSDLRSADARIGLAASTAFSPMGQVFGSWTPDVWPLRVAVSRLFFFAEEPGRPQSGTVLWPSAVAGMAAGWLVARRLIQAGQIRTSLLFGFAWFGSVALLDHSQQRGPRPGRGPGDHRRARPADRRRFGLEDGDLGVARVPLGRLAPALAGGRGDPRPGPSRGRFLVPAALAPRGRVSGLVRLDRQGRVGRGRRRGAGVAADPESRLDAGYGGRPAGAAAVSLRPLAAQPVAPQDHPREERNGNGVRLAPDQRRGGRRRDDHPGAGDGLPGRSRWWACCSPPRRPSKPPGAARFNLGRAACFSGRSSR